MFYTECGRLIHSFTVFRVERNKVPSFDYRMERAEKKWDATFVFMFVDFIRLRISKSLP